MGDEYRHYKGRTYTVICEGVLESDPENPDSSMVVYQGTDGKIWIRPSFEFHGYRDGIRRFVPIKADGRGDGI